MLHKFVARGMCNIHVLASVSVGEFVAEADMPHIESVLGTATFGNTVFLFLVHGLCASVRTIAFVFFVTYWRRFVIQTCFKCATCIALHCNSMLARCTVLCQDCS
jgi:hypothetical protein